MLDWFTRAFTTRLADLTLLDVLKAAVAWSATAIVLWIILRRLWRDVLRPIREESSKAIRENELRRSQPLPDRKTKL